LEAAEEALMERLAKEWVSAPELGLVAAAGMAALQEHRKLVAAAAADAVQDERMAKEQEKAAKAEADEESRPYWLWRAMLEECARHGCHRPADDRCEGSGLCITEWCVPCAAKAFLAREKAGEEPPPAEEPDPVEQALCDAPTSNGLFRCYLIKGHIGDHACPGHQWPAAPCPHDWKTDGHKDGVGHLYCRLCGETRPAAKVP